MCGRFVITNPVAKTKGLVKTAIKVEDNENYNAHPTQNLPVIKKYTNGNTLELLKWGIIPSWSKKTVFGALKRLFDSLIFFISPNLRLLSSSNFVPFAESTFAINKNEV